MHENKKGPGENVAVNFTNQRSASTETDILRSRVRNMARLLSDCKEVISQNVQERHILLDRIKYLEEKAAQPDSPSTNLNELKLIQRNRRNKIRITSLQKVMKKQKRELRLARQLNKRLFEQYVQLYQEKQCSGDGPTRTSTRWRKESLTKDNIGERQEKETSEDDSLIIPQSIKSAIWYKRRSENNITMANGNYKQLKCQKGRGINFSNNVYCEERLKPSDSECDVKASKSYSTGSPRSRTHSAHSKSLTELEVSASDQSDMDISLPKTPSSSSSDLPSKKTNIQSFLTKTGIHSINSGKTKQKLAYKKLEALCMFYEALKNMKIKEAPFFNENLNANNAVNEQFIVDSYNNTEKR